MENPMNNFFFIPVSFVTALVVFGFAAKWYYWPWATRVSFKDAATPILLMNATRFIGLGFLVPGLVSSELSPLFSTAAAGGDMRSARCRRRCGRPARCARWSGSSRSFWRFCCARTAVTSPG